MKTESKKSSSRKAKVLYTETAERYLSAAEAGNSEAQNSLCQLFSDTPDAVSQMPESFWEKVADIARKDEDYANFLLHCRYYADPSQSRQAYDYIRRAVRHNRIGVAALRLGEMYAQGIGTAPNQALANYFFEKANAMGSVQAADYIYQSYEEGRRDLAVTVRKVLSEDTHPSQAVLDRLRSLLERERLRQNYGTFSKLCDHIPVLYPDYSKTEAMNDILEGRETVNADLFFALSSRQNTCEFNVDRQDQILAYIYAPVLNDPQLLRRIKEYADVLLLSDKERGVMHCYREFSNTYVNNCANFWVKRKPLPAIKTEDVLPYIAPSTLVQMRKNAVACLISLRDAHPLMEDFLNNLQDSLQLDCICEQINDMQLKKVLMIYDNLILYITDLQGVYYDFLRVYRENYRDILSAYFDEFMDRLKEARIINIT